MEKGYSTDLIGDEAVRLIRSRERGKPLFLYVAFNAPHTPLQAPAKVVESYREIADKDRRTFAAMVTRMDEAVGRILTAIDGEGIGDNTLVLFFSDNGGPTQNAACNTPFRGGKRTCFEGGIRVPAVMRWPARIQRAARTRQVTTVMDLLPTLAAVAGASPRNRLPLDGKNLWPALSSGRVEPREDLYFGSGSDSKFMYAIFHHEWKLVREISRRDQSARSYLFRIDEDPEERNDLVAEHPDVVKDLAARIDKWRALYPADGIIDPKKTAPPGEHAPKLWSEAARRES